jgi:hypothetical protein
MKGTAVRARRMDLPRKLNLEKRMAAGSPRAKGEEGGEKGLVEGEE